MSPIESGNTAGNHGSIEAHQRILEPVRRAEWPGSTPTGRIRSAGRVARDGVQCGQGIGRACRCHDTHMNERTRAGLQSLPRIYL